MTKLQYFLLLVNRYKVVAVLKHFISIFALLFIKIKRLCRVNKLSHKKKRLFSTTGNISLINALIIIEQLADTNCEDYLIIESFQGSFNFWKYNLELAKLHKFKHIKLVSNVQFKIALRFLNQSWFDEIYVLNKAICLEPILELYPTAKINLFDEGCSSLILHSKSILKIKNLNAFYTYKYIDKIDSFGLPQNIINCIKPLDTEIFEKIANNIAMKYPIQLYEDVKDKKILYCGSYWQCSGLDEETFEKVQLAQISNLIKAGYHILFKTHPRAVKYYELDKCKNITFINSVLPVELYKWDVLAVVAMSSASLIHLSHFYKIPSFSNVVSESVNMKRENFQTNLTRFFIGQYAPNYKYLLNLDVKNLSNEILKQQIKKIYDEFVDKSPLLSDNKLLIQYTNKYQQ